MNKEKVIYINKLLKGLNDDSKKKASKNLEALNALGIEHFQKIFQITDKYKTWKFDQYDGGTYVNFDFREKNKLYFLLSRRWGDSSNQAVVSIEELSDFDYSKFDELQKQKRVQQLMNNIEYFKEQILKNEDELNNLLNKK